MSRKWGIKDLRQISESFQARQVNFGTYEYSGKFAGSNWLIKSFAHMAHLYDGDDENFVVRWHIYRDGKPVGWPTDNPIYFLTGAKEAYE
jgi:hypothetical protein